MQPYVLGETNWKSVKNIHFSVATLSWGATEAYNYHFPYATNVIKSENTAVESARVVWKQGSKAIYYQLFLLEQTQNRQTLHWISTSTPVHNLFY